VPSYLAVLDREGAGSPADVAIIGDQAEVERRIVELADSPLEAPLGPPASSHTTAPCWRSTPRLEDQLNRLLVETGLRSRDEHSSLVGRPRGVDPGRAGWLALDAYVHLDLAASYDGVKSSVLRQGRPVPGRGRGRDPGRRGAAAAAARRCTAAFALLVAAAGVAVVLVYQYIDVGAVGPLPDMYEPVWYPEKTQSAWGEGIAAVAALALLIVIHLQTRRATRPGTPSRPGLSPAQP